MIVKFKRFHSDAKIPAKGSELAGGWDVVVTEIIKVSDNFVQCNLGFGLQPPEGYKITMVPRSSFTKTNWVLQNSPCLGDEDYTGQYQVNFRAIPTDTEEYNYVDPNFMSMFPLYTTRFTYDEFPYKVGDRIAQMYIEQVIPIEFEIVGELHKTKRGENGLGSTGNK